MAKTWAGWVKFNVDGSSIRKPGPAGIGGLLRDHLRKELMRFSKSIGVEDSNVAELLAIREGLILFLSLPWESTEFLIHRWLLGDRKFSIILSL
ncbi:hypothetical protein PTKIN_Ptkin14bG0201600 [Pterospermum kingtungense]